MSLFDVYICLFNINTSLFTLWPNSLLVHYGIICVCIYVYISLFIYVDASF